MASLETVNGNEPSEKELRGRHQRNGHTLELQELDWKCLQCKHYFDAAVAAEKFFCGDPCKH